MMLKLSLFLFLLTTNAFSISVLVSKQSIGFEQVLKASKLRLMSVPELKKACIPLTLKQVQNNKYITTHYINKNSIICQKDVKTYTKQSVVFKFGGLEIEKKGKIVFENDEFIRIKKEDGTIEKIYKDGRLK
ncbi:hypothetical protein LPB137_11285 [Poseidonibacter parvus]|uniref:Flagellar P ring chaperone FlgA n=2 Tax=Poseidonibacter parvus TaxID=1850254 RepID=A0A1P8KPB4_9BACT|nr:hypothetical protein LPB137_11285 [Poseidonibacter parvus]